MRHYAYLQPHEQALVETVVRVVVAEIHWFGGPRFDVTEEMKVTVAAQASLLVLGFEEPYFFDRLHRSFSIRASTCTRVSSGGIRA